MTEPLLISVAQEEAIAVRRPYAPLASRPPCYFQESQVLLIDRLPQFSLHLKSLFSV